MKHRFDIQNQIIVWWMLDLTHYQFSLILLFQWVPLQYVFQYPIFLNDSLIMLISLIAERRNWCANLHSWSTESELYCSDWRTFSNLSWLFGLFFYCPTMCMNIWWFLLWYIDCQGRGRLVEVFSWVFTESLIRKCFEVSRRTVDEERKQAICELMNEICKVDVGDVSEAANQCECLIGAITVWLVFDCIFVLFYFCVFLIV